MSSEFEILNNIYKPLYDYVKTTVDSLKSCGYKSEWGYYGHHYIRKNNDWALEYFPIPVIRVNGICDIGIDLNHIFIEYNLTKKAAIKYDFEKLKKYKFEIYGVEEYLDDFYNENMDFEGIKSRIDKSEETTIGISIFLNEKTCFEQILEVVKLIEESYFEGVTIRNLKENSDKNYSSIMGKELNCIIDRPLGSVHPKHKHIKYYVNYGYVNGYKALDNEEQDIYLLGVDKAVHRYDAVVIAIIHRKDDIEDKWILAPKGISFTDDEILRNVMFQEKYFDIELYR